MIMASATPAYRKLFIGCQVALAGLAAFVVVRHRLRSAPSAIDFKVFGDEAVKKPQFSWADVVASDKLEWTDCYSAHQCARLNVPLNYSEPRGEKAAIAITRYPAAVLAGSPAYRGPILFNPGGPGGSGVNFIAVAGSALAQIVGLDILGFDPRGVAHSIPRVSFFETDMERQLWGSSTLTELNASSDALGRMWARAQVYNSLAGERGSIQHINTDNTARDMLRIVEAHGKEKLQYWGFSYGSVLGTVFATMFPDKVERILIDGVLDAENYFERCAFYAPTPEAISRNLTALYESLRTRPIPFRTPSSYGLIDLNLIRLSVFVSLYQPQPLFSLLAEALAALARGEVPGSQLLDLFPKPAAFECSCDPTYHQFEAVLDSQVAIICNDGRAIPSGFDEAEKHYQNMVKKSGWGSLLASLRIMCSGWPDIPKKHFQGPVTGNTSFPMLIIGNTADPITPLWTAKKMSKAFPDSIVLTQDCPGHTSLAAPSPCTWGYIREYFYNGTLPDKDTVCPVLGSPFPNGRSAQDDSEAFSVAQRVFSAFKAVQPNTWFRGNNFML
ncbi:TAP-like protein-domain-containing protein [Mycena leptocephala]|nr:TAP-like protein-domain-containing protein [Mycena leptocephala]